MRTLVCSALLSMLACTGFAGPISPSFHGQAVLTASPKIIWVHHEASDNAPPAQLLTALPAEDWPVTNWHKQTVYDLAGTKLGEIADVLVDHDGKNTAVLIGVGGLLGVGEKYVAVPFDAVHFKKRDNTWYPVVNTTKDALKGAPGFRYDRNAQRWAPEDVTSVGGSAPK